MLTNVSTKVRMYGCTDEPFSTNIDNEVIKNSNNKKLLGTNLNNRLDFDAHVTNICNRVSKELHALIH